MPSLREQYGHLLGGEESSAGGSLRDRYGSQLSVPTPDLINPADLIPAQELPTAVAQSTGVVPQAPVFNLGIDESQLPPSARLQPKPPSAIDRLLTGVAAQGRRNTEFIGEVVQPRINEAFPTVPTDELSIKNRSFSDLVSRGLLGGAADVAGFLGGQIPALLDPKKLVPEGTENPELQVGKDLASGISHLLQSGLVTADQLASLPIEALTRGRLTSPIKSLTAAGKSGITEEERQQILQEAVDRPQDPAFGALIASGVVRGGLKAKGAAKNRFAKAVERQRAKVEPTSRLGDLVKRKRAELDVPKEKPKVESVIDQIEKSQEITKGLQKGPSPTEVVARDLGIKFDGVKEIGKDKTGLFFSDPKTKGSFVVKNVSEVRGRLDELRVDFKEAQLEKLTPSKPTVKPKVEVKPAKEIDIADVTDVTKERGVESGFIEEPIKELNAGIPIESLKKKKSPLTIRAEERFLDITRERKARIYEATTRARNWEKRYSEVERINAGAIVEGIENLTTGEIPKLTLKLKTLVNEYRIAQEKSRTDINIYLKNTSQGDYISFLEDYLPHFYVGKVSKVTNSRWVTNSPNAKARKLPTLKEAVDLGLKPISQDVAFLHKMWADINWKVAANRQTVQLFKDMKLPDGGRATIAGDRPGPKWKLFDHPAISRIYARKTKGGETVLWRGGVWVHPDLVQVAKMAFENPLANRGKVAKAYDITSAYAKTFALSFSGFHILALGESAQAVLGKAKNPIRGLFVFGKEARAVAGNPIEVTFRAGKKFQEQNPGKVADFIRDGLEIGSSKADFGYNIVENSLRELEAQSRNIPIARWMTKKLRQGFSLNSKILWEQIHEGNKIYSHEQSLIPELSRLPENASSKAIKEVRESLARSINDAFGGQEWEAKFWLSPTGRLYSKRIMLAPDWSFSNLAIAFRASTVPKNAVTRRLTIRYWRNMAATILGTSQAFNYWSTGHSTFENELGKELDINITKARNRIDESLSKVIPGYKFDPNNKQQYYVRLGKQAREIIGWFDDPLKIASNKMNPVAREIFKQVTGAQPGSGFQSDWTREDIDFYESIPLRLKSAADIFTPFSFSGSNFAFALPMSKGMTPFKAIRFYQRALDSKGWLVNGKSAEMVDAIDEITKGVLLNGLEPKSLYITARSAVRGKYYKAYFDALEDQDFDKVNEIALILERLGATRKTIKASAKRRGIIK